MFLFKTCASRAGKSMLRAILISAAIAAIYVCAVAGPASAQAPKVAATPPMGWNSWNHFHGDVSDAVVRAMADAMVSSGMRDAGYKYINIDDTWEGYGRAADGSIRTNQKFTDMKALCDYVHSKGLKIGIYSSPGPSTCAGYDGSWNHEQQDADTYAAWGIDYLKYDWCSAGAHYPNTLEGEIAAYTKMHDALVKTGRPIVFSLCQYGAFDVWKWGPTVGGNLWRTTGDISDNWRAMSNIGFNQNGLEQYAAPGHWNDPDMLEVGNGGMTDDEYRTHFSLWCMLAAPLIAGNDLAHMTPATIAILCNKDVIAIDQDSAGIQGHRVRKDGDTEVWMKQLHDGSIAVGLFNRSDTPQTVSVSNQDLGTTKKFDIRDLWAHKQVAKKETSYSATLAPHACALLRLKLR
jgi:alpha-galactosidase